MIALCHAIEANDLAEVDRLIAAGADVNAKGKDNMTPLLWAFPDNKLERFTRLLEHGADPNVLFQSDFGTRSALLPGEAVTHLACETHFDGYFEAVFKYGGDPNLKSTCAVKMESPPLFCVITGRASNKLEKVKLLIERGADINLLDGNGITSTMHAVSWGGQFDIALLLLEKGANYRKYQRNQIQKLVHIVARMDPQLPSYNARQLASYQNLVTWLSDHGESVEQARADIQRWDSWSSAEKDKNMAAEIAARKEREAREKKQPKE